MPVLRRIVLTGVALFATSSVSGQTIRTLVVDSNGVPTSGGFLLLVDMRDREAARALNVEDGLLALRAPRSGQYRLVSERVGFATRRSDPFTIGEGETLDLTVRLADRPVDLSALPTTPGQCTAAPSPESPEGRLWTEVRKGLVAAMFTALPRHYDYVSAVVERDIGPDGRRVFGQQMRVAQGAPLYETMASAGQAARDGFIVSHDDGSVSYQAPDASVLLAPDFAATHCLTAHRDSASHVALLGFESRDDPTLRGTFRVSLPEARLEQMEYRFLQLPHDIRDDRVGGTVNFMEGPSGKLIARDWELRTPVVGLDDEGRDTILTAYRVLGGAIASVTDLTGTSVYSADIAELRGIVVDSLDQPLAGARVTVLGTDYWADADMEGRFRIAGLLDGEYAVAFNHASLESHIAPPPEMVAFLPGHSDSIRLQLMSVDDLVTGLVGVRDSATQLAPIEVSAASGAGRNVLSRADLQEHSDLSVYDAVLRMRPGWLRGRGVASLSGAQFSTGVFRNGQFIGGFNVLTRIDVEFVEEIRYYSRRDAQTRWGFGNDVIEIVDRK